MTVEELRARVEDIRKVGEDDMDSEEAHAMEDNMRADLLRYIAASAPEPFAELARVALETDAIEFERWCA